MAMEQKVMELERALQGATLGSATPPAAAPGLEMHGFLKKADLAGLEVAVVEMRSLVDQVANRVMEAASGL